MDSTTREMLSALSRTGSLAERCCELPAVATANWPDLAAKALTGLSERCLACICIAGVTPDGVILSMEAAGAAGAAGLGGRHPGDPRVLGLRSSIERLDTLGFPVPPARARDGMVSPAPAILGEGWARSAIGRAFGSPTPDEVIVGIHALGPGNAERVVVAIIGIEHADAADGTHGACRAETLAVTLPLLARRASLAIGSSASTTSRWLTEREQAVLERLTLGMSVREIADEIGRSPHTVHDHVKSLHRKLNASSRGKLVARALGYIDDAGRVLGSLSDTLVEPKGATPGAASIESIVHGGEAIAEPKPDAPRKAERLDPERRPTL